MDAVNLVLVHNRLHEVMAMLIGRIYLHNVMITERRAIHLLLRDRLMWAIHVWWLSYLPGQGAERELKRHFKDSRMVKDIVDLKNLLTIEPAKKLRDCNR